MQNWLFEVSYGFGFIQKHFAIDGDANAEGLNDALRHCALFLARVLVDVKARRPQTEQGS